MSASWRHPTSGPRPRPTKCSGSGPTIIPTCSARSTGGCATASNSPGKTTLILVGEEVARLVIGPRLVILRRRSIATVAIVVILLPLLPIGIGVVDAAAARRGIALFVRAAIGRVDIAAIGAGFRRRCGRLLLRGQDHGIA